MTTLTEQTVRQRSTSKSFDRGKSYYRQGAVFDTVRRGNVLEARCEGSQYKPYQVRVTLDKNNNITDVFCDCEYSFEGDCKHIIALLLTYVHKPELFEEKQPIEAVLKERSQEELIALIQQMLDHYPDLQSLVDRPVPGRATRQTPVNVETFRREIRQAIRHYSYEWGDFSVQNTIQSVLKAGKQFAENGDWRSASAIFRAIYDECLQNDDYPVDDEGDYAGVLDEVAQELMDCLSIGELAEDDTERHAIFESLLKIHIWNINQGGYDVAADAPDVILQHARKQDLPFVREKITAAKKKKEGDRYGNWAVENYESFLMDIDALDDTDPEIILTRLRESGQYHLLTEKLLALKRVDEALKVIREHLTGSYERLRLMESLIVYAGEETALSLAQASLQKDYHVHLASWLIQYAEKANKPELLLELRQKDFYQPPYYIGKYHAFKKAAQAAGKWDTLYPQAIQHLKKDKHFDLLTEVYLAEQAWEDAWKMLEQYQQATAKHRWGIGFDTLEMRVAEASRYDNPEKSLPIYRKYIRHLIDLRQRDQYAQAAQQLRTVEELYDGMDEYEKWEEYINGIKTEFKKLPALMDELRKAGF